MSQVDARGMLCPQPLIMTKKALQKLQQGQAMTVLIDNSTSKDNVERFLKDNGMAVSHTEEDGVYTLTVTKVAGALVAPDAAAYCAPAKTAPHVVCVKSDTMGIGDSELGSILIKAFINTIEETSPLPGTVIFYNRGVFLALDDSPVLDSLEGLSGKGIEVLVCGTCADFFKVKERVAVGTISNMYTISEALARASHVVYP